MSIKELFTYLDRLMTDSSLFITWDIVEKIKKAAQEDKKKIFLGRMNNLDSNDISKKIC